MHRERDRAPRSTGLLLLVALVGLGALATVLSVREERQAARLVDERAADVAASRIRSVLAVSIGAFRGADVLAVDGDVTQPEFVGFTRGLTDDELYQAVAFVEPVDSADRATFTERTGLDIHDIDSSGSFVPAAPRPLALVVSMVEPLDDSTRPVLGFDIAGDPVRRSAAEASRISGLPAIAGPVVTATRARTGIAVVAVIRDPKGDAVGYLSSALDVSLVLERAGVDPASFGSFALTMDDAPLVGVPGAGSSQSFDAVGHRFQVVAEDGEGINPLLPLIIGAGTLALLTATVAAGRRDTRQRQQLADRARRLRSVNDLGQALAVTVDVKPLLDRLLGASGGIIDATQVGVALRRPERPSRLSVRWEAGEADLAPSLGDDVRLASQWAMSECIRSGLPCAVSDAAEAKRRFPDEAAALGEADVQARLWLPLTFGGELCVGALGYHWSTRKSPAEIDELRLVADTIAELASRSLERVVTTSTVQLAADNLGLLARELASARERSDVQQAISRHTPTIFGAEAARLVLGDTPTDGDDPAWVSRSVDGRDRRRLGLVEVAWARPTLLGPAQSSVFDTIVEMVGQTLERIAMTEQEHQVIVELQRSLLPSPHGRPGLDLAVHYEPAMSVVGLGGDFYDVIEGPEDRIVIVIGDVTGHGSAAVAAMAELKTVIESQLRSGRDLEWIGREADVVLARRGMYATAQVVEIDPDAHRLRLVNAGHPFPLLRRADGQVEMLTGGHRPLLGLDEPTEPHDEATTVAFEQDDLLLLYTDGLIEHRSRPIDAAMRSLADMVGGMDCSLGAADVVDRVLELTRSDRGHDKTDDDSALIVVRLQPLRSPAVP